MQLPQNLNKVQHFRISGKVGVSSEDMDKEKRRDAEIPLTQSSTYSFC